MSFNRDSELTFLNRLDIERHSIIAITQCLGRGEVEQIGRVLDRRRFAHETRQQANLPEKLEKIDRAGNGFDL